MLPASASWPSRIRSASSDGSSGPLSPTRSPRWSTIQAERPAEEAAQQGLGAESASKRAPKVKTQQAAPELPAPPEQLLGPEPLLGCELLRGLADSWSIARYAS